MNILFLGSGEFALKSLEILLKEKDFNMVAVITQPDKPGGRGKKLLPTPVKKLAINYNIPVLQPENINTEEMENFIKNNNIDLSVVISYGQILKKNIIELPKFNSINLHPSLLPKYRGASPIQNSLLNGDTVTGVSIIEINENMDAGDILAQEKVEIEQDDDFFSLFEKLSLVGAELLVSTIRKIKENKIKKIPQDESKATYCKKISKSDGLINWKESSHRIFNKIRAFVKWPVCYSYYRNKLIKFYKAKMLNEKYNFLPGTAVRINKRSFGIVCGDSRLLKIEKLQLQGKKVLNTSDFLNGFPINTGDIFYNGSG